MTTRFYNPGQPGISVGRAGLKPGCQVAEKSQSGGRVPGFPGTRDKSILVYVLRFFMGTLRFFRVRNVKNVTIRNHGVKNMVTFCVTEKT